MSKIHRVISVKAVVPKYVSDFQCIGSDCEDTCCSGWKVTIDKKSFNFYKESKNELLKSRFDQKIKRTRSLETDLSFGQIELNENNSDCCFLENNLCSVQRELGEDKLSNTCFSFPRLTKKKHDVVEQALTLSCPEAARKALLSTDAFDLIEMNVQVREGSLTKPLVKYKISLENIQKVQNFCLELLGKKDMLIWQKLVLLGLFCESISSLIKGDKLQQIDSVIIETRGLAASNEFFHILESIKAYHDIQALSFIYLWRANDKISHSQHQTEIRKKILSGLGFDLETGQVNEAKVISSYVSGLQKLEESLKLAPDLITNYILNEIFTSNFPFERGSPFEDYIKLITRFGMVRFLLAAVCNDSEDVTDPQTLTDVIQVFCRRYQHNQNFANDVEKALSNAGWDNLDKAFKFIKS